MVTAAAAVADDPKAASVSDIRVTSPHGQLQPPRNEVASPSSRFSSIVVLQAMPEVLPSCGPSTSKCVDLTNGSDGAPLAATGAVA